jgi:hypothetical protein
VLDTTDLNVEQAAAAAFQIVDAARATH